MLRQPIQWRWHLGLGIASFAILMVLYTGWNVSRLRADPSDRVLPTWSRIYHEGLVTGLTDRDRRDKELTFWNDLKATSVRMLIGVALSVLVALPIGVLMGCYTPIEALLLPPMSFLAKIPGTAMLGVFFVIPGVGMMPKRIIAV
jgi:ABC-type nitrate/sulfonate/bicarbonate transport system permease component